MHRAPVLLPVLYVRQERRRVRRVSASAHIARPVRGPRQGSNRPSSPGGEDGHHAARGNGRVGDSTIPTRGCFTASATDSERGTVISSPSPARARRANPAASPPAAAYPRGSDDFDGTDNASVGTREEQTRISVPLAPRVPRSSSGSSGSSSRVRPSSSFSVSPPTAPRTLRHRVGVSGPPSSVLRPPVFRDQSHLH